MGGHFFYESKPFVLGDYWMSGHKMSRICDCIFDTTDWKHNMIERPEKQELPEWCIVGAWVWNDAFGYGKIIGFQHIDGDFILETMGCGAIHVKNAKQARIHPWNKEELKNIVGKTLEFPYGVRRLCLWSDGVRVDFIDDCDSVYAKPRIISIDATRLKNEATNTDGSPCGVLVHLNENGEWVE